MRPASEPTTAFAESNAFALALLGLEAQARRIDQALPRSPGGAGCTPIAPAEHPLDLALLGLISLAARLERMGEAHVPPAAATGPESGLLR